jgi:hypothetical protein
MIWPLKSVVTLFLDFYVLVGSHKNECLDNA